MIGYCCLSLGINTGKKKKDYIKVNRGMTRKTFDKKGMSYISELTILNLRDTLKVLDYNIKNNIFVYRLSSDSFPWMSEYDIELIPRFDEINKLLIEIGNKIKNNKIRVSYHPGPFNVLASEKESVVNKTISELNKHAQLMDLMQLDVTTYYPINIHVNTTKPDKKSAMQRFCKNFDMLSESCKKRLTVENDDSPSQYSVKDLYDGVYKIIDIPIVFDQHHFTLGLKDQTMEEAIKLAASTWKTRVMTHMSSPKTNEDTKGLAIAHADFIYERIETFGLDFDTEIEAKSKDLAVIKYRKDYIS